MIVHKKIIGLTPGSESGVGPELLLKAMIDKRFDSCEFFWCGDKLSLELGAQRSGLALGFLGTEKARIDERRDVYFLPPAAAPKEVLSRQAWFLQQAVSRGCDQKIDAVVTGPIDKAALKHLGPNYTGQTEYFGHHWAKAGHKPLMVFMGGPFILSLLTTHLPLAQVAPTLKIGALLDHIKGAAAAIATILHKPARHLKIDVLGFNPHAGEQGLLGHEESAIIIPAIDRAQKEGYVVSGPWPSDGYFAYVHEKTSAQQPDLLIAIYHDQGLIPYKLMCRGAAVNVTMGLSLVRTSPAHGTAEHLAGRNQACANSTRQAIALAASLIN